jgi:hypothetical protein
MSADADALLGAIEHMIKDGHTFQVGTSTGTSWNTQANVSGPSGSRSAVGRSAQEALEKLLVQIVEARLFAPVKPAPWPARTHGPFDDLPPDSYF